MVNFAAQGMGKLSAVIITFNEERNIARCIDSLVGVADEIVVVDSFSTDATERICLEKNVRFIRHAFEGYIQQKNFALEQTTHPVVLSLDADEALSDILRRSIHEALRDFEADAYSFNRLTNYCGQWVRHGGWYPDRKVRLIRKGKATWGGQNPHDRLIPVAGASVRQLRGDLLHYSYYSHDEHDRQNDRFSAIAAQAMFDAGKRSSAFKVAYKPLVRFCRDYIFHLGFLDGHTGWIIAGKTFHATRMKYKRLLDLQRNASLR